MDKKLTPRAGDDKTGLNSVMFAKAPARKKANTLALGPEQAETIRGFAEHIVKRLCQRHGISGPN